MEIIPRDDESEAARLAADTDLVLTDDDLKVDVFNDYSFSYPDGKS